MCAKLLQSCPTVRDLWTVAHQVSMSMGFSRQEYWDGLPCPPPGDLPDPGIKPTSPASPALAGGFFTTEPRGKPVQLSKASFFFSHLENDIITCKFKMKMHRCELWKKCLCIITFYVTKRSASSDRWDVKIPV